MANPVKSLVQLPTIVNVVHEVDSQWAEEVSQEICELLKAKSSTQVTLFLDGFSMSWRENHGKEPSGEFLKKDNFNLVIVSYEPFGDLGLMAPSLMSYVTDYLSKEKFYCPGKTAIIANKNLIRLNDFFDSPKLRFFSNQDFDQVVKFLT